MATNRSNVDLNDFKKREIHDSEDPAIAARKKQRPMPSVGSALATGAFSRNSKIAELRSYLKHPSVRDLFPKSILVQLRDKEATLRFDSAVRIGIAGRRGQSWADDATALRIYVAKQFGGPIGNALSPFHVKVGNEVLPSPFQRSTSEPEEGTQNEASSLSPYPLELWWQSAKMKQTETSITLYLQRRAKIYRDGKAKRSYFSIKKEGVRGAYFDGQIYQYVPSRLFYCSVYAQRVRETPAFRTLQHLHQTVGVDILLVGPDGFEFRKNQEGILDDYGTYLDAKYPFGHERVLSCMVRGTKPWETYRTENTLKDDTDKTKIVYPAWL